MSRRRGRGIMVRMLLRIRGMDLTVVRMLLVNTRGELFYIPTILLCVPSIRFGMLIASR